MEKEMGSSGLEAGGFSKTHMLHWIFPSFVMWTMRVRGWGLKRTVELLEAAEPRRDTSRSTGTRNPARG